MHENEIKQYLKNYKCHKVYQDYSRGIYKVVLGIYNLVAPTRPVFFVRGRWILSNFWHLVCYNFCYFLKKTAKLYFFEASQVSENTPKIISIGQRITEKLPWKLKMLSFLGVFYLKNKTTDIFNFLSVKYFGIGLLFLKIWHIRVNYC